MNKWDSLKEFLEKQHAREAFCAAHISEEDYGAARDALAMALAEMAELEAAEYRRREGKAPVADFMADD